jgi:hypothetical protein
LYFILQEAANILNEKNVHLLCSSIFIVEHNKGKASDVLAGNS